MIEQPAEPRDARALWLIDRSALARGLRSLMRGTERAARSSRIGTFTAALAVEGQRIGRAGRLRAAGVAVIIAVLVHVGLTVSQRVPVGWLWLVIPAIVLAQGIVLLVASSGGDPDPS